MSSPIKCVGDKVCHAQSIDERFYQKIAVLVSKLYFYALMVLSSSIYTFSIDYRGEDDKVVIVLNNTGSLEVLAQQAIDHGNRIRVILSKESHHKKEILVDRFLSFSPLIDQYLIIENNHISSQTGSFKEAYKIFTQWSFSKDMFIEPKKINIAYTNSYYYFPFSLLYLLPRGPVIYRKNLIIKAS